MAIYPGLRALAPQRAEVPEEPAIGIEFAGSSKPTHNVIGANRMNEHPLCVALAQFPVVDQFCHESDGSHLSHQRGIEADLIDAIHDLARARWRVSSLDWIDVYNENVARLARIDQREQRRVSQALEGACGGLMRGFSTLAYGCVTASPAAICIQESSRRVSSDRETCGGGYER
jgi:hypothetical protein